MALILNLKLMGPIGFSGLLQVLRALPLNGGYN